jgi:hypothetical protein
MNKPNERRIECKCGQWEEMSYDEQRWHSQTFKWLANIEHAGIYKCLNCDAIVASN